MSKLFAQKRSAITRTMAIVLALVLVVAIVAGEEVLSGANKSNGTTTGIDLHIYEDNPALQIDHYYPDTIYVPLGANISLAIQNGDDETRVFTLSQYGINLTIISGTTQRPATFTAKTLGNFSFISPITPPSAASGQLKGPCLEGFFVVVAKNSTLLSITSTGTGSPPSEAQVIAANSGPIGSCTAHPLTLPSAP
jgi:hypothetical protein